MPGKSNFPSACSSQDSLYSAATPKQKMRRLECDRKHRCSITVSSATYNQSILINITGTVVSDMTAIMDSHNHYNKSEVENLFLSSSLPRSTPSDFGPAQATLSCLSSIFNHIPYLFQTLHSASSLLHPLCMSCFSSCLSKSKNITCYSCYVVWLCFSCMS